VPPPLTVLVVEDSPSCARLMIAGLQAAGMRVIHAADGAEAIAATLAEPFDLALLDAGLPDMHGSIVAYALRSLRPSLPMACVSGDTDPETRARFEAASVRRYLAKPFQISALVDLALALAAERADATLPLDVHRPSPAAPA
jgi:two-component system KDP operon response regulator KdpE